MSSTLHNRLNEPGNCISERGIRDYVSGKLSPAEMHRVEKHALDCDLCSDAIEGLAQLKNKDRIQVLAEEVNKMLKKEDKKGPVILWLQNNFRYAAAAAVLLFVAGTFILKNGMEEQGEKQVSEVMQDKESFAEKDRMLLPPASPSEGSSVVINEPPFPFDAEKKTLLLKKESESLAKDEEIVPPPVPEIASGEVNTESRAVSSRMADSSSTGGMSLSQKSQEGYSDVAAVPAPAAAPSSVTASENQVRAKSGARSPAPAKKAKMDTDERLSEKAEVEKSTAEDKSVPEVYTIVEEMPEFPGGAELMKVYISKNIQYPPALVESRIEGIVRVGLIISEDGSVTNVKVLRGISGAKECDDEAVRVIKSMPNWKPGKQNGRAVRVSYTIPVKFEIN